MRHDRVQRGNEMDARAFDTVFEHSVSKSFIKPVVLYTDYYSMDWVVLMTENSLDLFHDRNEENAMDVSRNVFTASEGQVGTCLSFIYIICLKCCSSVDFSIEALHRGSAYSLLNIYKFD